MNHTSIHEISPPPLARSRRNDVKKSRHPGKCEAFIRDPGNALVAHFDSLDSGHCCATAQQFRNDDRG